MLMPKNGNKSRTAQNEAEALTWELKKNKGEGMVNTADLKRSSKVYDYTSHKSTLNLHSKGG